MHPENHSRTTAALVGVAVVLSLAGAGVSLWAAAADGASLRSRVLNAVVVLSFALVGAVVTFARPRNAVGWLMLAGSLAWALGNAGVDAAYRGIAVAPGDVPLPSLWAVAGTCVRGAGWFVTTLGVALFFPDGRLVGPRWRRLVILCVVALVGSTVGALTASDANLAWGVQWRNPLAVSSALQPASGAVSLLSLMAGAIATLGAVAQLAARWRRGSALVRQQLALFGAAAACPVIAGPLVLGGVAGSWLFSATALPLPFAIGFAVLARGLYDLKTAANRTLVWLTLSAAVVAVYALVIAGLDGLLGGAGWLPWVAAAAVAVAFAPLRDVLQHAVNRITFGRWEEPYEVLAALGQRLEASANADGMLADVVSEIRGLGVEDVAICDELGRVLAGRPTAGLDQVELPLSAYGERVGSLRYRPPTPLRGRDRRLLDDLAGHLGGVLHAHRLTADLQRSLERLVVAREEERRRLRRDLHDGVGPALAGHLLRLDLVVDALDKDSAARGELEVLREELRATVLEVRRVVEGLRPPALDELGLAGAVSEVVTRLTAGALAVDLAIGNLPRLPAAVEVAAFRIVSEAVANAVRHADATTCRVGVDVVDGSLRIAVEDDGKGFDGRSSSAAGHGLQTMRERAEELRGRLSVAGGRGTAVVAELPLPPQTAGAFVEPALEANA